jgi:hypothetical protein
MGAGLCYYARYEFLDELQEAANAKYKAIELQALQQVLAWLLQLPTGGVREAALDVLRQDGWLQRLLQCWAAEVQQTGCGVQQAAAAAAAAYAAEFDAAPSSAAAAVAAGTSRGIGGYLAGLCQLLLQLLGACCQRLHAASAELSDPAAAAEQQLCNSNREGSSHSWDKLKQLAGQVQPADGGAAVAAGGGGMSVASSADALQMQQLAGDLLAGTAVLLLHSEQLLQQAALHEQVKHERCTAARMWRGCLQYNLRRCSEGVAGVDAVASHVRQRGQQLQARLPGVTLTPPT